MAKKNAIGPKAARLLRRVARHILAEPRRFAMSWWIGTGDPGKPLLNSNFGEYHIKELIVPKCGTVACIAGWMVLLADGKKSYLTAPEIQARAEEILGKDADRRLFGTHAWPDNFKDRYDNAKTRRGKALAAAARIEHFIKTGE